MDNELFISRFDSVGLMKKIAVVGAGFAGLSVCYHLLKRGGLVTLFDRKGIGGGTSGIASGLLHPYPGEVARLSWRGEEAMREARHLLSVAGADVYQENGILKVAVTSKQESALHKLAKRYQDVKWLEKEGAGYFFSKEGRALPVAMIQSGITVHASLYLQKLWEVCERLGAQFEKKGVFLDMLDPFDCVVLAVGGGIREFPIVKKLNLRFNKGQLLLCQKPIEWNIDTSFIGKGYLASSESHPFCFLGSTYERNFNSEKPCMKSATDLIFKQLSQFFPPFHSFLIEKCMAGMRVVNPHGPYPILKKLSDKVFIVTGMGSRGLLYHGLIGKEVAEEILL